ncbi:hypothetical protein C8T65DRAFT_813437 [Cerioporus squamosus]|nr:hypothetical protein C8T65DRAFT_813437 [Cerioporus squamosus]
MDSSSTSAQTLAVPHGSTGSFRSSFLGDLRKSVLYNNPNVLTKLLAPGRSPSNSVDPSTIEVVIKDIVRAVKEDCAQDLQTIDDVASMPTDAEKRLYNPLKNICDKVEERLAALVPDRAYFRQVILTGNRSVALEDPVFPNSDDNKPDFVVADVPDPRLPNSPIHPATLSLKTPPYLPSVRWRQCSSFIEVKAKARYSPTKAGGPAANEAGKLTLAQGADYARFTFMTHPFNLFVYGVFVSGNEFCLGFFDRCGVVLSPDYTLTQGEGLRTFVRVVIRLLWAMSPTDLGQDPTVSLEPGHTYYAEAYPSYRITMSPDSEDTRSWITAGPPLWVSHTLLGRGTVVWRALGPSSQARLPSILKTAWRSSNRVSELDIYDMIKSILYENKVAYPRSVAEADNGGDVRSHTGKPVSVKALRGFDDMFPPIVHGISDRILHRVTVRKLGKPLWQYSSIEQLFRALAGAIEGHKVLSDNEIVHRDISAGNILIEVASDENGVLSDFSIEQTCGFLTDFELASVRQPDYRETSVPVEARPEGGMGGRRQGQHVYFESARERTPTKTQPGDGLTGTAIFMAHTVLIAVCAELPIVRTKEHDLESFLWVILYVVYKHAMDDTEVLRKVPIDGFPQKLYNEFRDLFSATSIRILLEKRDAVFGKSSPVEGNVERSDLRAGAANLFAYAQSGRSGGRRPSTVISLVFSQWFGLSSLHSPRKCYVPANASEVSYRTQAFGKKSVTDGSQHSEATHDDILGILNFAVAQIAPRRIKREEKEEKKVRKAAEAAQRMQVD